LSTIVHSLLAQYSNLLVARVPLGPRSGPEGTRATALFCGCEGVAMRCGALPRPRSHRGKYGMTHEISGPEAPDPHILELFKQTLRALLQLLTEDQNELVNLVGDKGERVAEGIEVLAQIMPDPVAPIRKVGQFQQLFNDIGMQHVMVLARRLDILAEQHHIAARLQMMQAGRR